MKLLVSSADLAVVLDTYSTQNGAKVDQHVRYLETSYSIRRAVVLIFQFRLPQKLFGVIKVCID